MTKALAPKELLGLIHDKSCMVYWEVGRRIVEYEQGGVARAEYGAALITRVSLDLTERFGRGFSKRNVEQMRLFYLTWPIAQMTSAQLAENPLVKCSTVSSMSFPLHNMYG